MKNFIYLPLIALIFLCSCKSNSFMTQRYTRFGHASHKGSPELTSTLNKTKEVKSNKYQTPPTIHNQQPQTLSASVNKKEDVKKPSGIYTFPKKIITPLLNAGNAGVSWVKSDVKKSEPQKLNTKKTFKEKMQKAAGLFSTAIRIVLFCAFVVIVVVAIILAFIVFG